ncbi:MAG: hypothetical protein IJ688_04330 [Treponema sp.]|nr:hypothetical protein [Treponema sp.]
MESISKNLGRSIVKTPKLYFTDTEEKLSANTRKYVSLREKKKTPPNGSVF